MGKNKPIVKSVERQQLQMRQDEADLTCLVSPALARAERQAGCSAVRAGGGFGQIEPPNS